MTSPPCGKLDSQDLHGVSDKSSSFHNQCLGAATQLSDGSQDAQDSDGNNITNVHDCYNELEGSKAESNREGLTIIIPGFTASSSEEDKDSDTTSSKSFSDHTPGKHIPAIKGGLSCLLMDDASFDFINEEPLETPLKLIPALKGSREKHGLTPKKLSVTWAPDVYDPPPSIASHTRGKKQQKPKNKEKENRKSGKKSHKSSNSSSRGSSSSKDKKQYRKSPREKPVNSLGGFDLCSPDSYCGGSFLSPLNKVHYSVAEAL